MIRAGALAALITTIGFTPATAQVRAVIQVNVGQPPVVYAAPRPIIVRRAGAPVAFGVDRMLGQQEVVIRPVSDVLVKAPGISGATDLGDGRPTLVLDLIALSASLAASAQAAGAKR